MSRSFLTYVVLPGAFGVALALGWTNYADARKARAFTPDRPVGVRWPETNALLPPGHTVYADDRGEWVTVVVHGNYVLCQWLYAEKRWLLTPLAHRPAPVVDVEEANKNGAAKYTTRTKPNGGD